MAFILWRRQAKGAFALIVGLTNTIALSAQAQEAARAETVLSFNPATVGVSASDAQALTASFTVTGYSGSFTPTASLHYGRHYSAAAVNCTGSGGTETCTVSVSFRPTLPGGRKDALLLMDGATLLSTVLLYGVGQSPLGLIQPGIVTQPILDNPDYLYQSAVDENGTVYVVSENSNAVLSLTGADVLTTLPITVTSPSSIAVDGAGTLYFGQNTYGSSIVTYSATGVQGAISMLPPTPYVPCSNSNGGTLEYLLNAAVDGLGNLFANELLCTEVFELTAGGSYVTTFISPAITLPSTMALDSAGNLFLGGYSINELTTAAVQTQVNDVGALEGLATDAAGTLYATRYTGGGVGELAASNYTSVLANLDPTASPLGASVGPDGTVYVGNYNNLDKIDRSQGAIAFGEQSAGTTSTPQDVAIYNGGNESLTLSNITIAGTGFAMQAASMDNCVTEVAIPPGALCQVAVTLTPPHAGIFSGTLALTSNSLNTTTTQNVALSGFVYGVYVTPSPDPLAFGYQAVDTTSAERMVTLTNNGDLYSATIGTPSSSDPAFAPTLGTCATSLAVGSSCQLGVTFAPTATQAYSGTVTLQTSSSGGGPNQTVTFTVSGTSVVPSVSDGGTEASTGADGSADAADGSPDASDASSTTTTSEEASTGTHDGAADGAPDASSTLDSGSTPPKSDASTEAPPASSSGGCGCRTVNARGNDGILPLVGFVALLTLRKRKRSRIRPTSPSIPARRAHRTPDRNRPGLRRPARTPGTSPTPPSARTPRPARASTPRRSSPFPRPRSPPPRRSPQVPGRSCAGSRARASSRPRRASSPRARETPSRRTRWHSGAARGA